MKLIIGEGGWNLLERISYHGCIGIFFSDTWTGLLAYIIFGAICIFAVIGFISVIALIFHPRKKRMSKEEKWLKTGKL